MEALRVGAWQHLLFQLENFVFHATVCLRMFICFSSVNS